MSERLERTTFGTSRLLDFMSEKELTLQCGGDEVEDGSVGADRSMTDLRDLDDLNVGERGVVRVVPLVSVDPLDQLSLGERARPAVANDEVERRQDGGSLAVEDDRLQANYKRDGSTEARWGVVA